MYVPATRKYVTFVAVSKCEQLPEDGQVRPKHVAGDCDFNVILN
jgi:hypothetical protein